MKSPRRMGVLLSLLAIVWCSLPHTLAGSCDGQWVGDFHAGDLDAEVYDIFQDGDHPIVAGLFRTAGDQRVNGVARLVDGQWTAMGPDSVIAAYCIGRYQGDIVLNGVFPTPGGGIRRGTARWHSNAWEMIGGPSAPELEYAQAITEFNGDLYVSVFYASGFGIYRVMRWDGTTWSSLPSTGGLVTGLSVHKQSLYACVERYGSFQSDGVVRWDGSAWQSTNYPYQSAAAIVEHQGVLYAGTTEYETELIYALGSNGWESVEGSYCKGTGTITSLVSAPDGLYICGRELNLNGAPNANVIRIDANNWKPFPPQPTYAAMDLGFDAGRLIVGGWLGLADQTRINNVAVWSNDAWSPIQSVGNGINGYPSAGVVHNGRLVISGTNCGMGSVHHLGVASWDGDHWQAEGAIEPTPYDPIWLYQLATRGDILYASGSLHLPELSRSYPLMQKTGDAWSPVDMMVFGSATDLITTQSGAVVTGNLRDEATDSFFHVGKWDGAAWHALGTASGGDVWCACEYGEQLIVGGSFDAIDGVKASYVARLGSTGWETVGDALPTIVSKLVVFKKQLYAATYYTDGLPPRIYVLEHDHWLPISAPDIGLVGDFVAYDGRLYFSCLGPYSWPTSPGSLRVLTPTGFEPVPGAPDDGAYSLTVYDDGNGPSLFAVGNFAFAGGRAASRIAQYTTCPCPADANGDNTVDGRDLSVFLSRFSRRMDNPYEVPDFNGDREVDSRDLSFLLSRFGKSCE